MLNKIVIDGNKENSHNPLVLVKASQLMVMNSQHPYEAIIERNVENHRDSLE